MDVAGRIICLIKGIYRTIVMGTLEIGATVSGHDFVDEEEHENCKVIIGKCEHCGAQDISWHKMHEF